MNSNLKEKINILFLKDIGEYLKNEEIKYVVYDLDGKLEVKPLPIFYTNYLYNLYNYLAYDYDELSEKLKLKYIFNYKSIIKKNIFYEYETKKYEKIKR